jgi:hypothetical protein
MALFFSIILATRDLARPKDMVRPPNSRTPSSRNEPPHQLIAINGPRYFASSPRRLLTVHPFNNFCAKLGVTRLSAITRRPLICFAKKTLDAADDTLPARLTCYLEKQGFSCAALDYFVQLADPNALEPMTRIIANRFLHHCGHILLKIMLLQDIRYPELPHIEFGSSFEPILGPN